MTTNPHDEGRALGSEHVRVFDILLMLYSDHEQREQFLRGYRRAGRLHPDSPVWSPVPPEWRGGGHYSINWIAREHAWDWLRSKFPEGVAGNECWIFLSTSGVHGTYCPLDDRASPDHRGTMDVTFLCLESRLVRICYGNVPVTNDDEGRWLRELVESSLAKVELSQHGNREAR